MSWNSPWSQSLTYNYSTVPDTNANYSTADSYPVAGDYSKDHIYFYNGKHWENTVGHPLYPTISHNYQGTNPNGHGYEKNH